MNKWNHKEHAPVNILVGEEKKAVCRYGFHEYEFSQGEIPEESDVVAHARIHGKHSIFYAVDTTAKYFTEYDLNREPKDK